VTANDVNAAASEAPPAGSRSPRAAVAVIHGRFQPLHVGHLEYLLAGKHLCDVLVVGITNPDPELTVFEPSDPTRDSVEANPFSFYERYVMVEAALAASGVPRSEVRIVPFPHGTPGRLRHYAPHDALYLLTIYDRWGDEKLARFERLGLATHVMWRRTSKATSGSEVRARIAEGGDWEALVPAAVADVIHQLGIDGRIEAVHARG
jgi:cytidyltransferase-like protein